MGTEMVHETSVIFDQLTRLMDLEASINVSHRESFRPYDIFGIGIKPVFVYNAEIMMIVI
jgi:hypothetical protein